MNEYDRIQNINRVVHEPVRLAILTVLSSASEADFLFLLKTLGLTKGNLSSHIEKLENSGYVEVKKEFRGKIPHTSYRITLAGRREFRKYWKNIKRLSP